MSPTVPAMGPDEIAAAVGNRVNAATPDHLPGKGLAQHPMLHAGEGYEKLFVVKDGQVIWTYSKMP